MNTIYKQIIINLLKGAQDILDTGRELEQTVFFFRDGLPVAVVPIPEFSALGPVEKDTVREGVRTTVSRSLKADAMLMISENWIVQRPIDSDTQGLVPSEQPDRKSAVVVVFEELDSGPKLGMAVIDDETHKFNIDDVFDEMVKVAQSSSHLVNGWL